jgi:excisionase family DNA binding protein
MEAEPRLLSVAQAASSLGISTKSVYKLLAAQELRGVRLLRDIRIPVADLDALVERRLQEAPARPQVAANQAAT